MSPVGSILPVGAQTSRPAEHKIVGIGSKNFASRSPGILKNGNSHFYPWIPKSMNASCGTTSTICWMSIQSIYSLLENAAPVLKSTAPLLALSQRLQKAIPSFYQHSLFRMVGSTLYKLSPLFLSTNYRELSTKS
jgi:hypothetical protein